MIDVIADLELVRHDSGGIRNHAVNGDDDVSLDTVRA
jgi:hypothetical protein